MIDFTPNEFEPAPRDELVYLEGGKEGDPPANAEAVRFYARLGMKPKSIQWMEHVNCSAMTIFNNARLNRAYEQGKAQHEIYLRTLMMEHARKQAFVIDSMLNRTVGKGEVDHEASLSPTDATKKMVTAADFKFKPLTIENQDEPWIEAA